MVGFSFLDECARKHMHRKFRFLEQRLRTLNKHELQYEIVRYKSKKDSLTATLSAGALVFTFLGLVEVQKVDKIPWFILVLIGSFLLAGRIVRGWSHVIFISENILREMQQEHADSAAR